MNRSFEKRYIGDGVYVAFDSYGFVLTTESGYGVISRIVLEPEVYHALVMYVESVKHTLTVTVESV